MGWEGCFAFIWFQSLRYSSYDKKQHLYVSFALSGGEEKSFAGKVVKTVESFFP